MGRTASTRDYLADAGRGVKLEEQTAENSTVLKYKSSDGSDRYIAASDSPDGGGITVEFYSNSPFPHFNWAVANTVNKTLIYEIDDIRVKDGADVSDIRTFSIGFNNYNNYNGSFWTRNNEKIEGTTVDTLISDPKIFDLIKADIIKAKYISVASGTALTKFEIHIMAVNAYTTINGYKYAGFPSADMMYSLYAGN